MTEPKLVSLDLRWQWSLSKPISISVTNVMGFSTGALISLHSRHFSEQVGKSKTGQNGSVVQVLFSVHQREHEGVVVAILLTCTGNTERQKLEEYPVN